MSISGGQSRLLGSSQIAGHIPAPAGSFALTSTSPYSKLKDFSVVMMPEL
jgi:hypothetical protein